MFRGILHDGITVALRAAFSVYMQWHERKSIPFVDFIFVIAKAPIDFLETEASRLLVMAHFLALCRA